MELKNIVENFQVVGAINSIDKISSGHINSTYKVLTKELGGTDYILQSINTNIFTNVPALTDNLARVTAHIRQKLSGVYSSKELARHNVIMVLANSGEGYWQDSAGVYWRMFEFIEGSKTVEVLADEPQAEALGYAFGNFQAMLIDLPDPALFEILPGFHNTALRIDNLKKRIEENPKGRLAEVQKEVDFLLQFEDEMKSVVQKGKAGVLPLRTVHQDTKLSNILFDSNNNTALCVIDLDTVMPGYLCYDFGDAVRGGMNNGEEDEEDLTKVSLNMNLFKGFAKGYASASTDFITTAEVDTLAFGAKLITYEQAVRFLDDYLNGDQYYQTTKVKHNFIRTRAQIKFFKELIFHFNEMEDFVKELYKY